jgi:hypothetical protein
MKNSAPNLSNHAILKLNCIVIIYFAVWILHASDIKSDLELCIHYLLNAFTLFPSTMIQNRSFKFKLFEFWNYLIRPIACLCTAERGVCPALKNNLEYLAHLKSNHDTKECTLVWDNPYTCELSLDEVHYLKSNQVR